MINYFSEKLNLLVPANVLDASPIYGNFGTEDIKKYINYNVTLTKPVSAARC